VRELLPLSTLAALGRLAQWSPLTALVLVGTLAVLAGIGWFILRRERRGAACSAAAQVLDSAPVPAATDLDLARWVDDGGRLSAEE
jgi:hypothetical protein